MGRKNFFLAFLLMLSGVRLLAQQNVTLSGYIRDAANGESLIGATVFIVELGNGAVTNTYGFYSVTIPEGTYTFKYRYIGYKSVTKSAKMMENLRSDVELVEEIREMKGVVIEAERMDQNVNSVEMSVKKLDISSIEMMPAFLGEVDVIKSIQLLPGVTTVGDGAAGFNVRGGTTGQNLVLLDEAPVYNSSHLLGFFSVFNPDAVKDLKLYKGGFPAKYGGRLASLLDIQMKEGNSKDFGIQGGVGTVFSRLTVEGPIAKDKASFIVAARRSYIDVFAKLFTDVLDEGAALNFWDLTLKTNYNINSNNRLYLSGYLGRDIFKFDMRQGFSWGNRTATVRWNHLFNDRLFFNLTGYYSDYTYELTLGEDDLDRFEWTSRIRNTTIKPAFSYFVNSNNELSFGGELLYYRFDPANAVGVSVGQVTNISLDPKYAYEIATYLSNTQTISPKLSLDYGLRVSAFLYTGPGSVYQYRTIREGSRKQLLSISEVSDRSTIADYYNFEPRFSVRYQLNEFSSLKASYNRMAQYIHLISSTTASNPLDVWTPSTNNISPQLGDQVAIGYFRNMKNNLLETSLELYYRSTENQLEYIDGAELLINQFIEADLLSGIGRAYGMEISVSKNRGRLTGWIGYTLSRTELQVAGINRGEWYPTRFDQLHNLSLTSTYKLTDRLAFSTNFLYVSGTPTTFPTSRYEIQGYVVPFNANDSRNNVRIENYHRLDLSIILKGREVKKNGKKRKNQDHLVFSLYNVYARKNPFSIYFSQGQDRPIPGEAIPTKGTRVAIIGTVIPAFSYNFSF